MCKEDDEAAKPKEPTPKKKEPDKAPDKSPEEEGIDSSNDVMRKFLKKSESS